MPVEFSWLKGLLLGLLLGAGPALGQVYRTETPQWFHGSTTMDLPFAATGIEQGPQRSLIALNAPEGILARIDPATGRVGPEMKVDGEIREVAATDPGQIALVVERPTGALALDIFNLAARGGLELWLSINVADVAPMQDPAIAYVPMPDGKRGMVPQLVLWDRAPAKGGDPAQHVLTQRGFKPGLLSVPSPFLLPMGLGSTVFAAEIDESSALLVDLPGDTLIDSVAIDGLERSAPSDLSAFVPALPAGGTPNVLIIDSATDTVTAISVSSGKRALIGVPLQISYSRINSFKLRDVRLTAMSDPTMQTILVGAPGSSRIEVLRRIKGGLDPTDGFELDAPLTAMTAVSGPDGISVAFAFLQGDGTQLTLSDLPAIESRLVRVVSFGPEIAQTQMTTPVAGDLRTLDRDSAIRLQRMLAALGYQVGAIDGMPGDNTKSALRAFQTDNGFDASGTLDEITSAALDAALADTANDPTVIDFDTFLDRAMGRDVDGARLMVLGPSQENPAHPCFGLNDYAPRALWPNAVKFANLLAKLEAEPALKVHIVRAYATEAYSRCLDQADQLHHGDFFAFDIEPADLASDAAPSVRQERLDQIARKIKVLAEWGEVSADLSDDGLLLHVVTRIGQHQAAIASYALTERGCTEARADVAEFARLLAGTPLAGREIMVSRLDDNSFVVSVEANNASELAEQAVAQIRRVSRKSSDGRTGRDAYVLSSRDLSFDAACAAVQVIPAGAPAN